MPVNLSVSLCIPLIQEKFKVSVFNLYVRERERERVADFCHQILWIFQVDLHSTLASNTDSSSVMKSHGSQHITIKSCS